MRRVLVTLDEAAVFTGLSLRTMNRWVSRGDIEPVACRTKKGHQFLYDLNALDLIINGSDTPIPATCSGTLTDVA